MDKKQQILDAALKKFVEIGFQGTPTSLIAKTADVATGTLFYYFKSKDELIDDLYQDLKFKFIDYVFSKVHPASGLKSQIQKIWISSVNYALINKYEHQYILMYSNCPFLTNNSKNNIDEFHQCFSIPIEEGISSKILKDLPEEALFQMASHNIFAMVEYFYKNEDKTKDRQLIYKMFNAFWDSIKA